MNLGKKGEKKAAFLLKKKGFRVLCRNYSCRVGEIDLIAKKGDLLVFCEVKTRNSVKYGQPFEAVNGIKQRRIKIVAQKFIAGKYQDYKDIRFDVISILNDEVKHIENAF